MAARPRARSALDGTVDEKMATAGVDVVALRSKVLELVQSLKPPVHVAALSMQYAKTTGHSIKNDYKGGMLRFLKAELSDKVVLMGEGNDTFIRPATPYAPQPNLHRRASCTLQDLTHRFRVMPAQDDHCHWLGA